MIKKHIVFFIVLFVLFGVLSCDQAPIFYNISLEPAHLIPFVDGSPTNMVIVRDSLFVGSVNKNKIFQFTDGEWFTFPPLQTNLSLVALAGIDDFLYALVMTGNDIDSLELQLLYEYEEIDGEDVYLYVGEQVSKPSQYSDYSIQTIFSAGGILFAGLKKNNDSVYEIFWMDDTNHELVLLADTENPKLLTGAAQWSNDFVFLSTLGGGIIKCNIIGPTPTVESILAIPDSISITGIIASTDTVIAVGNSGNSGSIFVLNDIDNEFEKHADGPIFTGGLGILEIPGYQYLLLGARSRSSSVDQGYRMLTLDSTNGEPLDINVINPGSTDPRWRASVGLRPVMHIMQIPGEIKGDEPLVDLMFAATSTRGLWSSRGGEWNAETLDR